MSNGAASFIGSIPQNYDEGLGPHIFEPYAHDLTKRIAALRPSRVLELAAGTGIVTKKLRDTLPDQCELMVTDLNEPMLEMAKAKVDGAAHTSFQSVDAMQLPFEDASFDAIACQFGVMFFPDKVQSYREAQRVLKPGGRYVLNAWGSWADNQFARLAHEVTANRYRDNPPTFYQVPFHYHDADQIKRDLDTAGFSDVKIEKVRFSEPLQSVEGLSRGLIFGNPVSAEIIERGGDCEDIRAELERSLDQQLGGKLDLMALVVTATKSGHC